VRIETGANHHQPAGNNIDALLNWRSADWAAVVWWLCEDRCGPHGV